MYRPLDVPGAVAYVATSSLMGSHFGTGEELEGVDLAAGNVNLVFRVRSQRRPDRSVVVKQALTHARRYPEFTMPLARAQVEHTILREQARRCPERVPAVLLHDDAMFLNVLEDLAHLEIVRDGLIHQARYPDFGAHVATFLARTLFYTSDFHLPSEEKRVRVAALTNPVLCKVTEDLVFTQPWRDDPGNRFAPALRGHAAAIWRDATIQREVAEQKRAFLTRAEALLHGDLHTGSIMAGSHDTRVIDPEFGCWGPMSFDLGQIIGNLAISYTAQPGHTTDPAPCRAWLVDAIRAIWEGFVAQFVMLWAREGNGEFPAATYAPVFLAALLRDAIAMAACEMVRRVLGLAHVADFETIVDDDAKTRAEAQVLTVATEWLRMARTVESIDVPLRVLALA